MARKGRGICPFSHDYRECYPECALYAEAVDRCSFFVTAMLLEDIQKIGVISYEKFVREEEQYIKQRLAEMETEPASAEEVPEKPVEETVEEAPKEKE